MVYINECIDVNTALKNSFKSMSCLCRIQQFPRVVSSYSFKSMVTPHSSNLKIDGSTEKLHKTKFLKEKNEGHWNGVTVFIISKYQLHFEIRKNVEL